MNLVQSGETYAEFNNNLYYIGIRKMELCSLWRSDSILNKGGWRWVLIRHPPPPGGEERSCFLEVTGAEEGCLQVRAETTTDSRVERSFEVWQRRYDWLRDIRPHLIGCIKVHLGAAFEVLPVFICGRLGDAHRSISCYISNIPRLK